MTVKDTGLPKGGSFSCPERGSNIQKSVSDIVPIAISQCYSEPCKKVAEGYLFQIEAVASGVYSDFINFRSSTA